MVRRFAAAGRWARLLLGLWLFAVGTFMTLESKLGLSPWDVLNDGLRRRTPLSFGTAVILVGVVLVVATTVAGMRPGPGTITNMLLIGVFVDVLLALGIDSGASTWPYWAKVILTVAGIVLVGLGTALYIVAGLGAGPRDGLMVLIATRARVRIGVARALVEGTAFFAGALLGGSLGLGTVLFALGIGPAVDIWFRVFGMDSSGRRTAPTL
ncbi:MAG TPA: membrane protein [Actinomycetota bacterium]|nr:membrane protein [Actinomycetota bacterium]